MSFSKKLLLALVACTTLGCQQLPAPVAVTTLSPKLPPMPALHHSILVPAPAQLFALTTAQKQDLTNFAADPANKDLSKSQLLFKFLQRYSQNFHFQGKTLLASEALSEQSGNCVSLALITHGLATHLGIQTAYRLTYSEPVLELTNDMLVEAYHVRSYLLERELGQSHLGLKMLTVDYYRQPLDSLGPAISEDEFFAMVYNNLAAEAWLAGQQDLAMAYNQQALQLQPSHSPSINLMAVMLRRQGNEPLAQQWYEYGIQLPKQNAMLLHNYLQLAYAQKDQQKISQLTAALAKMPAKVDPLQYLVLAREAEQQGELLKASRYYKLLMVQQPAMLQPVQGLLRIYLQRNDSRSAEDLLSQLVWQHKNSDKAQLYQTKLAGLRELTRP